MGRESWPNRGVLLLFLLLLWSFSGRGCLTSLEVGREGRADGAGRRARRTNGCTGECWRRSRTKVLVAVVVRVVLLLPLLEVRGEGWSDRHRGLEDGSWEGPEHRLLNRHLPTLRSFQIMTSSTSDRGLSAEYSSLTSALRVVWSMASAAGLVGSPQYAPAAGVPLIKSPSLYLPRPVSLLLFS